MSHYLPFKYLTIYAMIRLAKGSADDSKVEEKTDEEKAEEKKVGVFLILT